MNLMLLLLLAKHYSMKKILVIVIILATVRSNAQNLLMTDETTDIKFAAKNLFGRFEGAFKGVKGVAFLDSSNLSQSFLRLSFDATTGAIHDNVIVPNLVKEACLNTAKYPTIEFESTSITKLAGGNKYQFNGTLKVKELSNSISFPFTAIANVGGYDLRFTFPLNKKDFNLDCPVFKKINISVAGYAKRIVVF
ncbi:MAG: YceI family protein [Segetibacter sp.]|nr:YceI family protein [Segetibacter sp.]